jgi:hypothetical protein
MPFVQLASVKHRVAVGVPLQFNVRNADQTLLLARGQVIASREQLIALFDRGTLVDLLELQSPRERIEQAAPHELPALWREAMDRAGDLLCNMPQERFVEALDAVAQPLVTLIERDPDLAIFQLLRQEGCHFAQYGVNHSMHCAIAAFLCAHRLGLPQDDIQLGFKAALTMNVSMLELQGQLATQIRPLSESQRAEIHTHPLRSVTILTQAGVQDDEWLRAVREHHEQEDGGGYPLGLRNPSALAALLRRADVYTAKLSARSTREALAADIAARSLFAADSNSPLTTALVKEFGIYPPGCFVKLVSGETAVVLKRGATLQTPMVAAVTTPRGMAMTEALPRDTARREYGIIGIARDATQVRLAPEKLAAMVCD